MTFVHRWGVTVARTSLFASDHIRAEFGRELRERYRDTLVGPLDIHIDVGENILRQSLEIGLLVIPRHESHASNEIPLLRTVIQVPHEIQQDVHAHLVFQHIYQLAVNNIDEALRDRRMGAMTNPSRFAPPPTVVSCVRRDPPVRRSQRKITNVERRPDTAQVEDKIKRLIRVRTENEG